jgi:vacuolar-type H+-ATPase subunit H
VVKQPFDADVDVERIDTAFNRVLAAEAASRERVDLCRSEAERLVAAAEERARRIAGRADDRVLAVQRIADAGLKRALDALHDAVPPADREGLDAQTDARLARAIGALADEMIGGGFSAGASDRTSRAR